MAKIDRRDHRCIQNRLTQERHYLVSTKWPTQFCAGIDSSQDRNAQAVGFEPGFIDSDVYQLNQQTAFDKLHQHGFGHFAEMTP